MILSSDIRYVHCLGLWDFLAKASIPSLTGDALFFSLNLNKSVEITLR